MKHLSLSTSTQRPHEQRLHGDPGVFIQRRGEHGMKVFKGCCIISLRVVSTRNFFIKIFLACASGLGSLNLLLAASLALRLGTRQSSSTRNCLVTLSFGVARMVSGNGTL